MCSLTVLWGLMPPDKRAYCILGSSSSNLHVAFWCWHTEILENISVTLKWHQNELIERLASSINFAKPNKATFYPNQPQLCKYELCGTVRKMNLISTSDLIYIKFSQEEKKRFNPNFSRGESQHSFNLGDMMMFKWCTCKSMLQATSGMNYFIVQFVLSTHDPEIHIYVNTKWNVLSFFYVVHMWPIYPDNILYIDRWSQLIWFGNQLQFR